MSLANQSAFASWSQRVGRSFSSSSSIPIGVYARWRGGMLHISYKPCAQLVAMCRASVRRHLHGESNLCCLAARAVTERETRDFPFRPCVSAAGVSTSQQHRISPDFTCSVNFLSAVPRQIDASGHQPAPSLRAKQLRSRCGYVSFPQGSPRGRRADAFVCESIVEKRNRGIPAEGVLACVAAVCTLSFPPRRGYTSSSSLLIPSR